MKDRNKAKNKRDGNFFFFLLVSIKDNLLDKIIKFYIMQIFFFNYSQHMHKKFKLCSFKINDFISLTILAVYIHTKNSKFRCLCYLQDHLDPLQKDQTFRIFSLRNFSLFICQEIRIYFIATEMWIFLFYGSWDVKHVELQMLKDNIMLIYSARV